jgi:hypothetical protein
VTSASPAVATPGVEARDIRFARESPRFELARKLDDDVPSLRGGRAFERLRERRFYGIASGSSGSNSRQQSAATIFPRTPAEIGIFDHFPSSSDNDQASSSSRPAPSCAGAGAGQILGHRLSARNQGQAARCAA